MRYPTSCVFIPSSDVHWVIFNNLTVLGTRINVNNYFTQCIQNKMYSMFLDWDKMTMIDQSISSFTDFISSFISICHNTCQLFSIHNRFSYVRIKLNVYKEIDFFYTTKERNLLHNPCKHLLNIYRKLPLPPWLPIIPIGNLFIMIRCGTSRCFKHTYVQYVQYVLIYTWFDKTQ